MLFPYFLFRFTNAFRPPGQKLAKALVGLSAVLVVWTFALPSIPQTGEDRHPAFALFVFVFFVHWTVLSIVAATSLWRAGRAQPTVARRRMHFLAGAAALITVALILSIFTTNEDSAVSLVSGALGTVSVVAFFLGFTPPQLLRLLWRAPEQARLQDAIAGLLTFAETQEEVATRVLEPAAAIVGARAIAIRDAEGRIVAAWNVPDDTWESLERGSAPPAWRRAEEIVDLEVPGGSMIVVGRRGMRRSSGTRSFDCSTHSEH